MPSDQNKPAEYRLSVIIPVVDEQEHISGCLDRLHAQGFAEPCQIIVVDGDPQGSTLRAVRDCRVTCLTSEKGRGRQMNAGAAAAEGDILLFLHVDTRLPPNALAGVAAVMETNGYVGGAFQLDIDSETWFLKGIAALANLRSRLNRIPYGDQAIFISRACFRALGGFREIPIMEDLDLMRRIKRNGGKVCILDQKVTTSARRWEAEGPLYTTIRNQLIRLLYYLGVNPARLARFYRVQNRIRRRRIPLGSEKP